MQYSQPRFLAQTIPKFGYRNKVRVIWLSIEKFQWVEFILAFTNLPALPSTFHLPLNLVIPGVGNSNLYSTL